MKAFRIALALLAAIAAAALPNCAIAQTAPNWTYDYVPTTGQWNNAFASKQDYLGAAPILVTGGVMTGPLSTASATTISAGFRIQPGVAPSSPNNGDMWVTSGGLYVQINGATVGPLSASTAGSFAATAPLSVSFPGSVVTYALNFNASLIATGGQLGINLANSNAFTAPQSINVGTGLPTALAGTILQIGGANSNVARIQVDAAASTAIWSGTRVDGTRASPTALAANDEISSFNAWGWNGSALVGPVARMSLFAAQTFSTGSQGSYVRISTTPNGSTSLTDAISIENDGGVTLGSLVGSTNSKGAGTINAPGLLYRSGNAYANSASSPLVLNATTGALTCPTCVTSSGGGAITGVAPISVSAGGAVSLNTNGVTYAYLQQVSAGARLLGNPTGSAANVSEISLGATLAFSGTALQTAAGTGDVTWSANSFATTLATVNASPGTYGSSTAIPTVTVNGKGLVTSITTNAVIAPAGTLTGNTLASNVVNSSLTSLGTGVALVSPSISGTASSTGQYLSTQSGGGITANFLAQSTQPSFGFQVTGQATDQGVWDWRASGTTFVGRAVNDANNSATNWITVNRGSGFTIASVSIPTLNTVGTISTGVWQGTVVGSTYGGTGVNNGSFTITLGGNISTAAALTQAGAFAVTLTSTAATNSTLPAGTHTIAAIDAAQSWSQLQTFADNTFALAGSTSGSLTLRAAATSGSSVIRFPNGSTDFSATGGTSQFVKQASAGGALTVVRPVCADLSDSGAFCSSTSAGSLTGTVTSGVMTGSYTGITGVGTLTAGALGSGFTTVAIAQGGTGQVTAAAARAASGLNIDQMSKNGDSNYSIPSTTRTAATSAAFTASRTWTLPAANAVNAGQQIRVVDLAGGVTASNTLVIARAGSDTINGVASVTIGAANGGYDLVSDGVSAWSAQGFAGATGGTVTSVFSRSGAVVATAGDYTAAQIGSTGVFYKINVQRFTSGGTYTPSAGLVYAQIECVGGGGGGGGIAGGGSSSSGGAGGGASGGYSRRTVSASTIGASQTVTIGAAGSGGAAGNNAGGSGGATSVGTLCVANGGGGGGGSSGANNQGGSPPGPGTGDVAAPGQQGGPGIGASVGTVAGWGGTGGSTQFGGGGPGGQGYGTSNAGFGGTGYGSGGGGAGGAGSLATAAGGAGGAGIVVITEFLNQ